MRSRTSALLLGAALVLAGCTAEGTSDAPTSAPAPGVTTSAAPAVPVEVVSATLLTSDELDTYGGVAMLTGPASRTGGEGLAKVAAVLADPADEVLGPQEGTSGPSNVEDQPMSSEWK